MEMVVVKGNQREQVVDDGVTVVENAKD